MVMREIKIHSLSEAGQSLVEFALVTLFVILPVTFGIIDGGILFYKWVAVNNGAREGARAGAIYQDTTISNGKQWMMLQIDDGRESVIIQAVERTVGPLVTVDDSQTSYPDDPCVSWTGHTCDVYDVYRGGDRVTVAITHTHSPLVGLVIGVDRIDLTASATMSIEPGGAAPTPTP